MLSCAPGLTLADQPTEQTMLFWFASWPSWILCAGGIEGNAAGESTDVNLNPNYLPATVIFADGLRTRSNTGTEVWRPAWFSTA